jgi:hypothetical protein
VTIPSPEIRTLTPDSWLQMPAPVLITGFLRMWLAAHFSDAAKIAYPELRSFLWTSSVQSSKILIEVVDMWKPSLTEQRPGILIARNAYKDLHLGMGDRLQGWQASDGAVYHSSQMAGIHTLIGVSKTGREAEAIGEEVHDEFLEFGELIRSDLNLMQFRVMELGEKFRIKEAPDNFGVPVPIAIRLEKNWKVTPHASFIKGVKLSIENFL